MSILFNKSPWSDPSSQASNDGREDSKDKDMKPSDGRKTNGSHEPPPQYADMAGQVPTSPGVSHLWVFFYQKFFLQRCFFRTQNYFLYGIKQRRCIVFGLASIKLYWEALSSIFRLHECATSMISP